MIILSFWCSPSWLSAFVIALLLSAARPAAAQTPDTARIRYSQETVSDSLPFPAKEQSVLSKLTRLQVEEHRLWKLGLTHFMFAGGSGELQEARYGLNLIYEQKLRPNWSVLAEVTPEILRYRTVANGPVRQGVGLEAQAAARYYYNLNRRIRKGRSASNFSANYVSLALGTGVGRHGYGTPFSVEAAQRGEAVRATVALLYGLQRRLGRYGFVDVVAGLPLPLVPKVGPLFPNQALHLLLDVRLGLALGR